MKTLVKVNTLSTLVTPEFNKIATDAGFTSENFASLVLNNYAQFFAESLRQGKEILSASPLDEQDCSTCQLKDKCKHAFKRNGLICFEAILFIITAIVLWLTLTRLPVRIAESELMAARRHVSQTRYETADGQNRIF